MIHIFSCFSCGSNIPWKTHLCHECKDSLPYVTSPKCLICSLPLITNKADICGECLSEPKYFNFLITPFYYGKIISGLIQNFKFHRDLAAGKLISGFLAEYLKIFYLDQKFPELIIPVPLFKKRLRKRGFNQAYLISKWVRKKLKINSPIGLKYIRRTRPTNAQINLNRQERLENLKQAFEYISKINPPKHVALVDDVFTTGTTVGEICKILKKAGVERIDIWCLARAIGH